MKHNLIITASNADEFHPHRAQPSGSLGWLRVHWRPNTSGALAESARINSAEPAAGKPAARTRTTAVQRKSHGGPAPSAVLSSLHPGERLAKARDRPTGHAFSLDQSSALCGAYREQLRGCLSLADAKCHPGWRASQAKSIGQGTPLPPPS